MQDDLYLDIELITATNRSGKRTPFVHIVD